MDDLDHSMCISEDDWVRFSEECEECSLPQPLPASPDSWDLSDLEDSDFTAGHVGQEPPAKSDKLIKSTSRRGSRGGDHSLPGGENDDFSSTDDGESERLVLSLNYSAVIAAGEDTRPSGHATAPLPAEEDPADDEQNADRDRQGGVPPQCGPISRRQGSEDLAGGQRSGPEGAARTEKERWFVTVNDSPARQRVHVTAAPQKRRLKQPRGRKRLSRTAGWAKAEKTHLEVERERGHLVKTCGEKVQKVNLFKSPLMSAQHDGAMKDPSCPTPRLGEAPPHTGLPGSDTGETEEPVDDSDSCPPATESLTEPQQPLVETQEDAEDSQARAGPSMGEGHGRTPTPPLAAPTVNQTWEEGVATLTSGPRPHETNPSPSGGGLSGDQLSPAPFPVLKPCSLTDGEGRARPVFSISAFWDEMEKMTINDILQLREAQGGSPRGAPAAPAGLPVNRCLADDKSPGGVPADTSDTADSDYFTQLDESRPDHWGCDLSTSDLEEELLLGTSRNSSPDGPRGKEPGSSCSPYLADEEGESTASEGAETPVPQGDVTHERLSCEDSRPRGEDGSGPALRYPPDESSSGILLLAHEEALDNLTQMFNDVIGEDKAKSASGSVLLCDPDPALDYRLLTFRDEILFTFLRYSQGRDEETIPIFSYSHPIIRTLTFPGYVFLNPVCRTQRWGSLWGSLWGSVPAALPPGTISLHHDVGAQRRSSGARMLPPEPPVNAVTEGGGAVSAERQTWELFGAASKSRVVKQT